MSLLKKDFKSFELIEDGDQKRGVGVASIVVPIETLLESFSVKEIVSSIEDLMKSRNLGLFFILTNHAVELMKSQKTDKDSKARRYSLHTSLLADDQKI